MSTASTAKRRRRQAANGFGHMAPLLRPHYTKRSADVAARRLQEVIARQRQIAARKGAKK